MNIQCPIIYTFTQVDDWLDTYIGLWFNFLLLFLWTFMLFVFIIFFSYLQYSTNSFWDSAWLMSWSVSCGFWKKYNIDYSINYIVHLYVSLCVCVCILIGLANFMWKKSFVLYRKTIQTFAHNKQFYRFIIYVYKLIVTFWWINPLTAVKVFSYQWIASLLLLLFWSIF